VVLGAAAGGESQPRAPPEPLFPRVTCNLVILPSTRASSTARRAPSREPRAYVPWTTTSDSPSTRLSTLRRRRSCSLVFGRQVPSAQCRPSEADTLRHARQLDHPSRRTGIVKDCRSPRCAAIGTLSNPFSGQRNRMYEDLRQLFLAGRTRACSVCGPNPRGARPLGGRLAAATLRRTRARS